MFRLSIAPMLFVWVVSGLFFWSGCGKETPTNPPTGKIPVGNPIVIGTGPGSEFYIAEDFVFSNNVYNPLDYVINCPVYIMEGNTVVEPGTRISFAYEEAGIFVTDQGSFTANGTSDRPIVFDGVNKYAGAWAGIFFGTANENNKLNRCIIKNAGGHKPPFMDEEASVGITREKEELRANRAWISNTLIYQSGGFGVFVSSLKGYFMNFSANTIAKSAKAPLGIPFRLASQLAGDCVMNPDTAPNTRPHILLYNQGFNQGNDLFQPAVFLNHGIPYRISGTEGVTMVNAPLTLSPGTILEFDIDGGLCIKQDGSLNAIGTAADPITFKGVQGGNGKWVGIAVQSQSAGNVLSHCIITGGGSKKAPWSDGRANIVLGSYTGSAGKATVSQCQITHSGGWAIAKKSSSDLTESGNQFIDNQNQPDVFIYP